jgi:ABC-type Fe3+ transport system permease subunit
MSARTAGTLVAETVPPAAIPVRQQGRRRRSPWLGLTSALVFAFLYAPLLVVVLYSFSSTKVNAWPIKGYTLDWYRELLADRDIHQAVQLSIIVGLCARRLPWCWELLRHLRWTATISGRNRRSDSSWCCPLCCPAS